VNTIEALLEVDEAACTEVSAEDMILERGTDRWVAIVGHFPFVDRVRRAAAECWVVELRARDGQARCDYRTANAVHSIV
jgi:hypothetical protein